MQDIDTEKLREIVEIMVEHAVAYIKYDKLEVALNPPTITEAIGFEAQSTDSVATENKTKQIGIVKPREAGYVALFNGNVPSLHKTSKTNV